MDIPKKVFLKALEQTEIDISKDIASIRQRYSEDFLDGKAMSIADHCGLIHFNLFEGPLSNFEYADELDTVAEYRLAIYEAAKRLASL